VVVGSAAVDDAAAAPELFAQLRQEDFPRLNTIWTDNKYHNHQLYQWMAQHRSGWRLEPVRRPKGSRGFVRLPKR